MLDSIPQSNNDDQLDSKTQTQRTEPPKLPTAENINELRKRVQDDISKHEQHTSKPSHNSELTTLDAKSPLGIRTMDG